MTEVKQEAEVVKVEKAEKPAKAERPAYTERPKRFKKQNRRKVCAFCVDKSKAIDYKDVAKLRHYVTEKGKILPRRQTGTCSMHQRMIAVAVKRARVMALLPFKAD